MIISASRRTDIPALYPEWFMNRLLAGEVLVPNPYNRKNVSRIRLSPDVVDCFVFWTKNPEPMLPYLDKIDMLGYRYYFQMTINGYGKEMEPGLPDTTDAMAAFILLSERLGKERVDWRYDPIILNEQYTLEFHREKFEMMCEWLAGYTTKCTVSFVDACKNSPFSEPEPEEMVAAAKVLSKIAKKYGLSLYTCSEPVDLEQYGIRHGACIDKEKMEDLTGYRLDIKKDRGQRKGCGCFESIDIGMYNTCIQGCRYCYATAGLESAKRRYDLHDPESPVLIGRLLGDETVLDKRMRSSRDNQLSLF